jgi:hypothetical protein
MIRYQDDSNVGMYRIQVGQNRYKEKRGCIEKTNEAQPDESKESFMSKFSIGFGHIVPNLSKMK